MSNDDNDDTGVVAGGPLVCLAVAVGGAKEAEFETTETLLLLLVLV